MSCSEVLARLSLLRTPEIKAARTCKCVYADEFWKSFCISAILSGVAIVPEGLGLDFRCSCMRSTLARKRAPDFHSQHGSKKES